jgi:hypothetical protein
MEILQASLEMNHDGKRTYGKSNSFLYTFMVLKFSNEDIKWRRKTCFSFKRTV